MKRKPIKLPPKDAADWASDKLGRRITPGAMRQWKLRGFIAGGRGWIDGEDLLDFIDNPLRWPGSGLRRSAAVGAPLDDHGATV